MSLIPSHAATGMVCRSCRACRSYGGVARIAGLKAKGSRMHFEQIDSGIQFWDWFSTGLLPAFSCVVMVQLTCGLWWTSTTHGLRLSGQIATEFYRSVAGQV